MSQPINSSNMPPRPLNTLPGSLGSPGSTGNAHQPHVPTPPPGSMPTVLAMVAQTANYQTSHATAVQQQSSNEGLFGCIKAGLASFKAAISSIFTKPPAPPSPSVQMPQSVSVSVNGQTVNIMREQFEPMIMSLPESQRQAAVTNLQQTLSQRVRDGLRLMDTVLTSPTPPPLPPPP